MAPLEATQNMSVQILTRGIAVIAALLSAAYPVRGDEGDKPGRVSGKPPLFDGQTFEGWVTLDGKPVPDGWEIVDGTIHLTSGKKRAGHIKSTQLYENFVLEFDWRIAAGGNSGVKYLLKKPTPKPGKIDFGCEYQLLDDDKHPNAKSANKTAGSLYDLYPADAKQKRLKPVGEYNQAKIIVDNGRIEHWLNGKKVVAATVGSADWNAKIATSKFRNVGGFAVGPGAIMLQDHGAEAWFKNLRITPLPTKTSARPVDFAHEVMPVLTKHCGKCHMGEKKRGGLAMNTRAELLAGGETGAVVVPGNAGKSLLIKLITSTDDGEWMPPDGPRLSATEIVTLKTWVDAGLPWDAGVTLGQSSWEPSLKPRVVALPPAHNSREHPIDRLLDADLVRRGRKPPPSVSDAAFLRRATLDAVGLLPTPEELDAFVTDPAADKREKRIDQLLADDVAYADHWLTTWNDLLRNDYTGTGFITGGRKQITPWLYAALRENKPYDVFVRELISPTPASAGFIDGIQWRGDVNASQTRDIQFAQNISQVFLGINMKCASCHDSFIDRWTLAEAYNLAAIYAERPLELNRCDKPTGVMATPKWIFPELGEIDPKASKADRLTQLAGLMTHPDNGRFTRTVVNRVWERLMGRGIVHPSTRCTPGRGTKTCSTTWPCGSRRTVRFAGVHSLRDDLGGVPVAGRDSRSGTGHGLRLCRAGRQADDRGTVPRFGLADHRGESGEGRRERRSVPGGRAGPAGPGGPGAD